MKNKEEILNYWANPSSTNKPIVYLKPIERSCFLLQVVKKYASANARILEPGCNVGRNLNHLYQAGYNNLTGIDINKDALQLLETTFPQLSANAKLHNAEIEDVIKKFKENEFDLVYTMAVLEHIHPDSEWIFADLARITGSYLITIEDEAAVSWRHVPRNYKKIFEPLGLAQIEEGSCIPAGLSQGFRLRVFRKKQ